MTVMEYVADQVERMGENYCHFILTTRSDRLDWQPAIEGSAPTRSILEQVAECITVNHGVASIIRGGGVSPAPQVTPATASDACSLLTASIDDLAAAIRGMSESDLDREFTHPKAIVFGRNLIMMPLRNMGYHIGQLNLIQMLYGDGFFNAPARWR